MAEKELLRAVADERPVSDSSRDGELAPAWPLLPVENYPGLSLTLRSVEWERVWVTLTFEFDGEVHGDVDLVFYDTLRAFPVTVEAVDARTYVARINVTNFRERQQVPNGSWRFMSVLGGRRGPIASYALSRASELESFGRSYLYNKNRSTYVVTFGLSHDDRADVIMRTYQLNRPAPKVSGSADKGRRNQTKRNRKES